MESPFKLVEKFNHELVGVPVRPFPYFLGQEEATWLFNVIWEERDELINVLAEERMEFMDAWYDDEPIEQIDALMDLIYFAMGGLTRLGVTAEQSDEIFKCIHERNMLKKSGNKDRGSDLDATKPADWDGPEEQITKIMKGETDAHDT